MTNEEAIEIISKVKELPCGWCYEGGDEFKQAINLAIKALEERPQVELEKVLVANVTFDENKLKEIVQTEVIDKINSGELVLKGEWIPVSERLPEKNMACLVAVGKINLTQIAVYSDLMGTINRKIFYQGDYGHKNFEDITQYVNAWQPLPEPYKKGGAE